MSNKSVGPGLGFEVPYHEAGVHGAGGELFHVRVEGDAGHSVSMTLEVSLQRRVFLQDRYFQIMLTINIWIYPHAAVLGEAFWLNLLLIDGKWLTGFAIVFSLRLETQNAAPSNLARKWRSFIPNKAHQKHARLFLYKAHHGGCLQRPEASFNSTPPSSSTTQRYTGPIRRSLFPVVTFKT